MLLYRINRACIGYIKCSHFAKIDEFGEKPADTLSLLPINSPGGGLISPRLSLHPDVLLSALRLVTIYHVSNTNRQK